MSGELFHYLGNDEAVIMVTPVSDQLSKCILHVCICLRYADIVGQYLLAQEVGLIKLEICLSYRSLRICNGTVCL